MTAPRPAPGRRGDYRAFDVLPTRWSDNDIYGHMNNVVHYALFDTAVNNWLMQNGILDLRTDRQIGIVAESGCRYHAEMAYPDRVTAGLRVARIGTSSIRFEIGLFRNDDDAAAAEGHFVHVFVDAQTRRPVPLPAPLRAAALALVAGAPGG